MNAVLYVHGKGGSAAEAEHYKPLFPGYDVIGLGYRGQTEYLARREIGAAIHGLRQKYDEVILIANSIGAYYSMRAGVDEEIEKAFFISPIVDLEKLIVDIMTLENVTEEELEEKGRIPTAFGEVLSWDHLTFVRQNPIKWSVLTHILYGRKDAFTDVNTMQAFAETHGATLTVMENGEHWFHTDEQMKFLDEWIKKYQ